MTKDKKIVKDIIFKIRGIKKVKVWYEDGSTETSLYKPNGDRTTVTKLIKDKKT